jgi:transcriptional regulator of acetoin/glycerol metabolism
MKIDKRVLTRLKRYAWPGNIRELQHAVERAVILNEGRTIENAEMLIGSTVTPATSTEEPQTMDEMEKRSIQQSLAEQEGNVTNTARKLGMTRTALYRRMKKHGLQ